MSAGPGGHPMAMIDRQARDLPLDAHLHTDLSPDSDVPIDVFAAQAAERGIAELAITDHVDFEPGAPAFAFTTYAQRERTVREAAETWAERGVAIRFGVEITWDSRWADDIREHLATHAYDFVIGSVHVYADSPYAPANVRGWVAGRSLREIMRPYFEEAEAAAQSGLLDALGHLDMVKRYLVPHVTPDQLAAAPELYEPILAALVETGTGLEINTSGLRQAANETYPLAGDRGSLPRTRWSGDHGGLRCAPRRHVRVGPVGRVRRRGRGRVHGTHLPTRWRAGAPRRGRVDLAA